jgi:hypothetical protein
VVVEKHQPGLESTVLLGGLGVAIAKEPAQDGRTEAACSAGSCIGSAARRVPFALAK